MPASHTVQPQDAKGTIEYLILNLKLLIKDNDYTAANALCSSYDDTGRYYYSIYNITTALANLEDEELQFLFKSPGFLRVLADKIHQHDHFNYLWPLVPDDCLFALLAIVKPKVIDEFKQRYIPSQSPNSILDEMLFLQDLARKNISVHSSDADCVQDNVKSCIAHVKAINKNVLYSYIGTNPGRILKLLKMMHTLEEKEELIEYLNTDVNPTYLESIAGKRRDPSWYSQANFVMVMLLRPNGHRAYKYGCFAVDSQEAKLLKSSIEISELQQKLTARLREQRASILDITAEDLSESLELVPAHKQKEYVIRLIESNPEFDLFKTIDNALSLNQVLNSLQLRDTKEFLLRLLSTSAKVKNNVVNYISNLYQESLKHESANPLAAVAQLISRPEDREVVAPYVKNTASLKTIFLRFGFDLSSATMCSPTSSASPNTYLFSLTEGSSLPDRPTAIDRVTTDTTYTGKQSCSL